MRQVLRVCWALTLLLGALLPSAAAHADGEDLTGSKWVVDGLIPYKFFKGKPGQQVAVGQFDPSGQDKEEKVEYVGTYDGKSLELRNPNIDSSIAATSDTISARISQDGKTITGTLHQVARAVNSDETNPITFVRIGAPGSGPGGGPGGPGRGPDGGPAGPTTPPVPPGITSGAGQAPTLGGGGGAQAPRKEPPGGDGEAGNPLIPLVAVGGAGLLGLAAGRTLSQLTSGQVPAPTERATREQTCEYIRKELTETIPAEAEKIKTEYYQRQKQRETELQSVLRDRKANYLRLDDLNLSVKSTMAEIEVIAGVGWIMAKLPDAVVGVSYAGALKTVATALKSAPAVASVAAPPAVAAQVATATTELAAVTGVTAATANKRTAIGTFAAMALAFGTVLSLELVKKAYKDVTVPLLGTWYSPDTFRKAIANLEKNGAKLEAELPREMIEFRRLDELLTRLRDGAERDTQDTNDALLKCWRDITFYVDAINKYRCGGIDRPFHYAPEVTNHIDMDSDPIIYDDLQHLRNGELPPLLI